MGPKKTVGKASAQQKPERAKPGPKPRKKPGPKPKRATKVKPEFENENEIEHEKGDEHEHGIRKTKPVKTTKDGVVAKRKYKPRAKKPSLVLSLQNSPDIREKGGKNRRESENPRPLMMQIPNLTPETGDRRKNAAKTGTPVFVEPEVAAPKPGYSGHPLEALPPLKLKRAGGAGGAGRGRKWKVAAGSRMPTEPPLTQEQIDEREASYRNHLQTTKSESLTGDSSVRSKVKGTRGKRRRRSSSSSSSSSDIVELSPTTTTTTIELPPTPKYDGKGQGSPNSFSVKRIKIISPKRSNALLGNSAPAPQEPESDANDNDDFCSTCGGTGVFICCDTCPKSFHLLCCNPPLRDVPEDNWNCGQCTARLSLAPRKVWNDLGMFGTLVNSNHGRIPTEFRLPKRLRDSTFIGVSTGDGHAYDDSSLKQEISYTKANRWQIPGFNRDETLEIESLYDEEGNPYLCHKCGLSGLNHRTLTFCDYCPLSWHLDCLPSPMCSAKTRGQKWRCPNHVASLVPSFWTERRSFKDALVLDAAAHHNFLRFSCANNFLVKFSDQPYLEQEGKSLQDYEQFQAQSFFSKDTDLIDTWRAELDVHGDSEDETESGENVTPEYLQNFAGPGDRIVAKSSPQSTRLLLMTNADDPDQEPFVYRVPEQQVLLDFMQRNKAKKQAILRDIEQYDEKIASEKKRDMEAVETLLTIHEHNSKNGTIHAQQTKADSLLDREELQYIRKLVQAKGKDALLQFLTS